MSFLSLPKQYSQDFANPRDFPKGPVDFDLSNPLTDGLVFAVYCEGAKTLAIRGGESNTALDDGGATVDGWDQTLGAGTTSVLQYTRPVGLDYSKGSIATTFERTSTPQSNGKLFITTDAEFQLFRNTLDRDLSLSINNVGAIFTFTDDVFDAGVEKTLSVTWNDVTPLRTVNVSGDKQTSAVAFTGGTESFATYNLLNRADGLRHTGGLTRYHLVWNRELTDEEFDRVHENPYQLLKPGVVPVYSISTSLVSVSSVTPDPSTPGATLTISGAGFGAVQGTGAVTQEQGAVSVGLTETAWADTEITATGATVESTQLKYGATTIKVSPDAGGSATKAITVNPLANNAAVDLTSVALSGSRITAIPDLAANDQIRYQSVLHQGGSPTAFTVVVNPDATFTIDGATTVGSYAFEVRAWDDGDQTWGTAVDQTFTLTGPGIKGIVRNIVRAIVRSIVRSIDG